MQLAKVFLFTVIAIASASHPKTAEKASAAMEKHIKEYRKKVAHGYEKDLKAGMTAEQADAKELRHYLEKFDHEAAKIRKHLPVDQQAAFDTQTAAQRVQYEAGIKANPDIYFYQTPTTTTVTPWDSSSGSSGTSSDSLASDSFSPPNGASDSWYGSFGSRASGSSGSYLQMYQWLLLAALLCCLAAVAGAATQLKPAPKPKKKKAAPKAAPAPAPAPEPELEPLFVAVPEIVPSFAPVTTASMPTVSRYAAPATTAYAMPATTTYAMPAAYSQPVITTGAYAGGVV